MAESKNLYRLVYLRTGELHQLGKVHDNLRAVRARRTRLRNDCRTAPMITAIQVLEANWKGLE